MIEEKNEWPEFPENEGGLDWSLNMGQLEKKYLPKKVAAKSVYVPPAIEDDKPLPINPTILDKMKKKYPYAYELICRSGVSRPMWVWVYDNILNQPVEIKKPR